MRLFIAVNFDEEAKQCILAVQDRIRKEVEKGKFSPVENLHLTLVFLGETPEKKILPIKEAMTRAVSLSGEPSFTLMFSRAGFWRRGGKELWYLGTETQAEEKKLKDLQEGLAGELIARGFLIDAQPFTAHITLGREIRGELRPFTTQGIPIAVKRISLMLSENNRQPGGKNKLVYTELFGVGL